MPIITIDWTEEKTAEEKQALIHEVAMCVSKEIQCPDTIVNVLIREIPVENVRFPAAVVTATWTTHPNRSVEAKRAIIEQLTKRLVETTEIKPERVVFFFHDLPGPNVGVAGVPKG